MPKISIIIPVYNSEKYLPQCVESILSQTFRDFELILVNDFSGDNSLEICNSYLKNDNRIKVINNMQNHGCPLSRKIGLNSATGNYILHVDSDDWIESNMLEQMYSKAVSGDCDMVYCDYWEYDLTGKAVCVPMHVYDNAFENVKNLILGSQKGVFLWNKLVKKDIYDKVLFPKEGYAEDKVISLQLFHLVHTIGYINSPFYHFRFNANSMSRNPKAQQARYQSILVNYAEILYYLFAKYDDLSPFEPELSQRIKYTETYNPDTPINIFKNIIKFIIPSRKIQHSIRSIINKLK